MKVKVKSLDDTLKFTVGGSEYTIFPLTYRQLYEVQGFDYEDTSAYFKLITFLSGCPEEILRGLSVDDFSTLKYYVMKYVFNFSNAETNPVIEVSGVRMGLVDFKDMSIGEFADLDVISNREDKSKSLHEIVSILYRPIKHTTLSGRVVIEDYDSRDSAKMGEIFLDSPVLLSIGCVAFFLSTTKQSLKNTVTYLQRRLVVKMLIEKLKHPLRKVKLLPQQEGGHQLFIQSLETTYYKLSRLQNYL